LKLPERGGITDPTDTNRKAPTSFYGCQGLKIGTRFRGQPIYAEHYSINPRQQNPTVARDAIVRGVSGTRLSVNPPGRRAVTGASLNTAFYVSRSRTERNGFDATQALEQPNSGADNAVQ